MQEYIRGSGGVWPVRSTFYALSVYLYTAQTPIVSLIIIPESSKTLLTPPEIFKNMLQQMFSSKINWVNDIVPEQSIKNKVMVEYASAK